MVGSQIVRRLREKAAGLLSPQIVPATAGSGGWITMTSSPYWFQSDTKATPETILSHPTVYACVSLIANDIAKLRCRLMQLNESTGIWTETSSPAFSPVLRQPNHYQNHIQFKQWWVMSKLTNGNTYALKQRDGRGVVVALYILDSTPGVVTPLVAPDGSVFYRLQPDNLTGLEQTQIVVPASEIIHDRMNCLFHPLVGVGPLFAASLSADQGLQIMKDGKRFFSQGAKPSGVLAAPGQISETTAKELKEYWTANFTGENAGKVAVVGDGLQYQPIRMTAVDAQVKDQLKLTSEMVAQAFLVPAFKLGGQLPAGLKPGDMNQIYYQQCLHTPIEELEACLDEGLALPAGMRTELELDNLLRMDPGTQAEVLSQLVSGSILTINGARRRINEPPLPGGDTVYMQQQDYPLEQVRNNVLPAPAPAPTPAPAPAADAIAADEARELVAHIMKGLECEQT